MKKYKEFIPPIFPLFCFLHGIRDQDSNLREIGKELWTKEGSGGGLLKPWTKMSQYIVDISGVGLPDTISANDGRSREKSENIGQYRRYITDISVMARYIGIKIGKSYNHAEKCKKKNHFGRYRRYRANK